MNVIFNKITMNPFNYYKKVAGFTFCTVALTNYLSTIKSSSENNDLFSNNPGILTTSLFAKSAYYAVFWPFFYITAITKPRNAFILYSSYNIEYKDKNHIIFKKLE